MEGYIHSTESFGTVDGPGIRFVVFFQGCPMRCQYCHNPDTWKYGIGEKRTVESLLEEYEGLKEFLKSGGITATGGEPLMQMEFVKELFREAKKRGIHTCLDSSGIMFRESKKAEYDELMKYTDLVMLDIKHIDDEEHKKLTGHSNKNILAFAEYLRDIGKDIWIRHVVVPGITLKEEYLRKLGYFIGGLSNLKALDVLPYHTMGIVKYQQLEMEYPLEGVEPATKEQAVWAKNIIFEGLKERLRDENKNK
ncbi:MAG: pyruvate formate-lyase-activating protein [Ruminococcus sp.]